jgi:glutamyl endopeptidase
VSNARAFPFRAIVYVHSSLDTCSGFLYGNDIVATAGHCLHTAPNGTWAPDVMVTAALNGADKPFGSCQAKRLYTVKGWIEGAGERYDYGAIKLDPACAPGMKTGWFGIGWSKASPVGKRIRLGGYPSDPGLVQKVSPGVIREMSDEVIFYDADTWQQMSGGPVFVARGCDACAIGFNAHRIHDAPQPMPPFTTFNHSPLIDRVVYENLKAWKDQP